MFKSPVRNQRSKGIRVKHVLQVCFLLAICFWLIYQVKHSHDKKKALEETDVKQSAKTEPTTGDILKLGRKDPILKEEKPESNKGKLNEAVEDEETIGNDEENKNEEAVVQEEETGGDNKEDDEGGEDEVEEIDEHELEKTDEEADNDEEAATEEEEEKGEEEKETKGKDGEDSVFDSVENEKKSSKEQDDVEDETIEEKEESTHEAREENYKADDASSAVTQTSQGVEKSGKGSLKEENLVVNTNSDTSGLETTASNTGGREIAEIDVPLNTAINQAAEEVADNKSEIGLSEQSNDLHRLMNDTAQINTVSDHLSVQDGTETEADRTLLKNVTLLEETTSKDVTEKTTDLNQVKNSIDAGSGSDTPLILNTRNSISSDLQSSDIKSNTNNEAKPKTIDPDALLTMDDVTRSSENVDNVHNDPIDSSDSSSTSLEEKNNEKDIEMLANVVLKEDGNQDAAAE